MSTKGSPPTIPVPDFAKSGVGQNSLSYDAETQGTQDVLVHFKVCTTDTELTRRITRTIMEQMAGQKVGERGISCIITDESIEMNVVTKQQIAAQITPLIASALGIQVPV